MSQLWQFVALLGVHWVGDFFFQSHWMSVNKSKRNDALAAHVGVYTLILGVGSILIFRNDGMSLAFFLLANGSMHYATDYWTSRWSSRLWAVAFTSGQRNAAAPVCYPPRNKPIHNFFVVIGVDQYIHQLTLAATMWWLL